jgi:signal transduction histidine kinase
MLFGKTGFKISGSVGIIILLLGITILFGVYQMSKVSNEIIMISQAYEPLQNILGEIKFHQSNQMSSFEKINSSPDDSIDSKKASEMFWSSNVMIKSSLQQAKRLTETSYSMAPTESIGNNFKLIRQMFVDIEQTHDEFEELTKNSLNSVQSNQVLLNQINTKEQQFTSKVDSAFSEIKKFNEQSINSIEEYERGWLFVQIGIILVVGIIAVFLRHFIGQISNDLKKEIDEKTHDLQEANKKLQDLDKRKNEFISIASHELKSPIQPIFGFAELAQSGDIDQKEAWDGVTTLAKKLQDLATDVLDVTRIESNRLTLYPQKFAINELILESTKLLKTGLAKDIEVVEDLDENIELEADRTRLEQVLRNILNNAAKFTESGTITVRTRLDRKSEELVCTISDTGLGIPDDILPDIFGKFITKGHERENQSGNGLGLFLCKGIITAHNGRISAYNNKDRGATFEFSLPLTLKKVVSFTN